MIVLNFAHPLNQTQVKQLEDLCLDTVEEIRIPVQLDLEQPVDNQIQQIVNGIGWSIEQWQKQEYLVIPPSLSTASAVLIADILGRSGALPLIVRSKMVGEGVFSRWEIAEIVSLESVKNAYKDTRRVENV